MSEHKPKKIRLALVNAAEDVPRLARAYGRTPYGEVALVLRPAEERGVLVLVSKTEGAFFWRAPSSPVETSDAPARPTNAVPVKDVVALVKTEQRALPKAGPITLRGQWRGWLVCDGGQPCVEMERKLATYGVLRIVSAPERGWTWNVERTEKWFSEPGADTGTAPTLLKAIESGLARAMGLLGEACSVRDSRRRAAFDTEYAQAHPVKPAVESKDPTERFKPQEPRRPRSGSPWRHYAHDDEAPDADPIVAPTRAVLARLKAGELTHDEGAGTYLGQTVEVFDGFPVGSLMFREAHDQGFYLHMPVRSRQPKAAAKKPAASSTADEGLQPGDRAVLVSDPSRVGTVLEWRGEDRVVWQEDGQTIRAVFAPSQLAAVVAEPAPVTPPAKPKPSRRRKPAPTEAEPAVDPAQDKALIDAFSSAVAAALGGT